MARVHRWAEKRSVEDRIIDGLFNLLTDVRAGRPAAVTRVTCEETPDELLHTRKQAVLGRRKKDGG